MPNAAQAARINARGDIVGTYLNADGVYVGFLAVPIP
jgi:hypothetical protein